MGSIASGGSYNQQLSQIIAGENSSSRHFNNLERNSVENHLAERIQFLRDSGIDAMGHSGQGLLDHLLGTRALLKAWGAGQALCDGGMFHSVYGTEVYQGTTIPRSMREGVREVIGEEAETLAWLFGVMRRHTLRENFEREGDFRVQDRFTEEWIPINSQQLFDLANVEVANALEQTPRLAPERKERARFLLDFKPFILPSGVEALNDLFGDSSA